MLNTFFLGSYGYNTNNFIIDYNMFIRILNVALF